MIGRVRELGLRRSAAAAARRTGREAAGAVRRAQLRRRPLAVEPGDVRAALGGVTAEEALRGRVLAALPTVAAWEPGAEVVARADQILAHRFDLLGSGPVELGPEIDWQLDFKSGRRWPLDHISRLPITYADSSDVKVPWELSRFQHLPLLAAATRVTGNENYVAEVAAQLESWIAANPVEFGANWLSTMDVAIRASNWVATLALLRERSRETWFEGALASLLLHGRFIRGHLETGSIRGNHYLSNVVGLLPVAALFAGGAEGRAWAEWVAGEVVAEMAHQVRPDGVAHEASIPYHRLVCELFICGTDAVDALDLGRLPEWYRRRLDLMLEFARDSTRPDGLAPLVGDSDDGRFLPLGDYGAADPRSQLHLFAQARRVYEPATASSAYGAGGFYVLRSDELYVLVRCGDTGLGGRGWHAHNDQLSFELALGTQPLVVDPGSYLYTSDPAARNLFRSTAFHATLQVDGLEQNELRASELFVLRDRTRAERLAWACDAFEGRHHGYSPAVHTRRLELDGSTLIVTDAVTGAHELEWTFPLAEGARVDTNTGGAVAEWEGATLEVRADGVGFAVESGWYAPRYGVRVPVPFLRARRRGAGETRFELRAFLRR